MRTGSTRERSVTMPITVYYGATNMSQEQDRRDDVEEHRERIRRIIDENRDILDELA